VKKIENQEYYKSKTFRARTKYDYITLKLGWDYNPSIITDEARQTVGV